MSSTIDGAVKNINVIDVEEFHNKSEKELRSLIKKCGEWALLPNVAAPYDVLNKSITKKYALDNPEEFVSFGNSLLEKKCYIDHGWVRHAPIGSFLLKDSENSRRTRILFDYDLEGCYSPLLWFEKDSINKFAFFTSNYSKNSGIIEGIYLYGSESMGSPHFIMIDRLYYALIGSQKEKLRRIAER